MQIDAVEQRPGNALLVIAATQRGRAGHNLAPDRKDNRSGRDSSPPPAGSAPDNAHAHWPAPQRLRRFQSVGANCPARRAGIPAAHPGTAPPDAPGKLRRASTFKPPPTSASHGRRNDADCPERPCLADGAIGQFTGQTLHHWKFPAPRVRIQRRQDARQACCASSDNITCAGRADHSEDYVRQPLQSPTRAWRISCAFDVFQIRCTARAPRPPAWAKAG